MDFKDLKDKMHAINSYIPDLIELNNYCFVCKRFHFHFLQGRLTSGFVYIYV